MRADWEPLWFMKRRELASLVSIGGDKYLDIMMERGCVGTLASKGCGMMGMVNIQDIEAAEVATLEYVYASDHRYHSAP